MNPAPRAVVPLLLLPPLFALWPGAFCSTPSAEYTAVRLAAASLGAMLRQRSRSCMTVLWASALALPRVCSRRSAA